MLQFLFRFSLIFHIELHSATSSELDIDSLKREEENSSPELQCQLVPLKKFAVIFTAVDPATSWSWLLNGSHQGSEKLQEVFC
jgi:hypothetical protein